MKNKYKQIKKRFINSVYINREYSLMQFNKRVLEQATDKTNPLLERCNFLNIYESNTEEFYMVRVGRLLALQKHSPDKTDNKTELTPEEQLNGIYELTAKYNKEREKVYKSLKKELASNGIKILSTGQLRESESKECARIYKNAIKPFLNPIIVEAKHSVIRLENLRQYLFYALEKDEKKYIGIVPICKNTDKLYRLRTSKGVKIVVLDDIVRLYASEFFSGYEIRGELFVKVLRNANFEANISSDDLESNYRRILHEKLKRRLKSAIVRLDVNGDCAELRDYLCKKFKINSKACFESKEFTDYKFLKDVTKLLNDDEKEGLCYKEYKGYEPNVINGCRSVIDVVKTNDVFLAYPYNNMNALIRLLDECATREDVKSINITIYRVAENSVVIEALKKAAKNGKQVTVIMELNAKFDEQHNINIAKALQNVGCKVVCGNPDYKVHCKLLLIILQNATKGVEYITHFGSGNYNEQTSEQYTDFNILTANENIGRDAAMLFEAMTTGNGNCEYTDLIVAPKSMKQVLIEKIDAEISKSRAGKKGFIYGKMNGLSDVDIIDKLVEAGDAGVEIRLIVRGVCCVLPGISDKTENLQVVSIVGRFLEHSRAYVFGEGAEQEVYISSADLMSRNLKKRIETAVPVYDGAIKKQIVSIMDRMWKDSVKATRLCSDGEYRKQDIKSWIFNSQTSLMQEYEARNTNGE